MIRDHNQSRNVVIASETQFVSSSWNAGLRPDQRTFLQIRDVAFEFPFEARNLCLVRLGHTEVTAHVECTLVEPSTFQPRHGFLEFHCSTNVTDGGSGVAAPLKRGSIRTRNPLCEQIVKRLDAMIKQGKALDTESLCVLPGASVWSVRVDICILNDEGNAFDAAAWAAMAALLHTRREEVSVRGETVIVHPAHERDPIPLSMHHCPIPITCVIAPSSTVVGASVAVGNNDGAVGSNNNNVGRFVVDPTLAEFACGTTSISVALNAEDQVCNVLKEGGTDVPYGLIRGIIGHAKTLCPQIRHSMDEAMKVHDARRKEALRAQFQWAQTRTGVGKQQPTPAATTDVSSDSSAKRPRSVEGTA